MEPSLVISLAAHGATQERRVSPPLPAARRPVILSQLPGRVRFRVALLYRAPWLKSEIEDRLTAPHIVAVAANDLTGSVLVLFEPDADVAELGTHLAAIVERAGAESAAPRPVRAQPSRPSRIARVRQALRHQPPASTINQTVWIASGVCVGVFAVWMLRGYGVLQMLKHGISLAVPEGLPTVATTTLALGLREMRRRKVLIRRAVAVTAPARCIGGRLC